MVIYYGFEPVQKSPTKHIQANDTKKQIFIPVEEILHLAPLDRSFIIPVFSLFYISNETNSKIDSFIIFCLPYKCHAFFYTLEETVKHMSDFTMEVRHHVTDVKRSEGEGHLQPSTSSTLVSKMVNFDSAVQPAWRIIPWMGTYGMNGFLFAYIFWWQNVW